MQEQTMQNFIRVLHKELIPALGCTEPIAIAYAAAKARAVLGTFPERVELCCSGNIIKNVKGVTVPNSNGLRGVGVAAVLGVVGGNADRQLEVLQEIKPEHIEKTKQLLSGDYFSCTLQKDVENLYIVATVYAGEDCASVTIINRHTLITDIVRNGEVLYRNKPTQEHKEVEWEEWSLKKILEFAEQVELSQVSGVLQQQIQMNSAISELGLNKKFGAEVGRTLMDEYGNDVKVRARARAAAGSDARMDGCSMPVVINSGSGNQGITVCLPVVEYAKELQVGEEKLLRALLISNLVSIYQKHYIGSLSAFCGAVTAACGAGAAITYLHGGSYEQICKTIVNTAGNVGGIICDGAKASCAAKIASAVDAAILAHHMSMRDHAFLGGEGIIQEDIEDTIRSVGYVGRVGMKETDVEILEIMMDQVEL